jgi:hypothetical protein
MTHDLESAIADWNAEVDREAAKMIREGVPPFDAVQRARDLVQRRRSRKAVKTITTRALAAGA